MPRDRIAAWLGVRDRTAGSVLMWLYDEGVIEFQRGPDGKPVYCYTSGHARLARYICAPPGPPSPSA